MIKKLKDLQVGDIIFLKAIRLSIGDGYDPGVVWLSGADIPHSDSHHHKTCFMILSTMEPYLYKSRPTGEGVYQTDQGTLRIWNGRLGDQCDQVT